MPTEIREVLMDRDELSRLVGLLVANGDAAKLCNIPAGAVFLEVDTWGRTTRGDKVRIALYSIEVPGPETTMSVAIGDGDQAAISLRDPYPELDGARSVDELNISVRTSNNLKFHGIYHLRSLVELTAFELLKLENFGKNSLEQIERALGELGMKLWGR